MTDAAGREGVARAIRELLLDALGARPGEPVQFGRAVYSLVDSLSDWLVTTTEEALHEESAARPDVRGPDGLRERLTALAAQIEADIAKWVESGPELYGEHFDPDRHLDLAGRPIMLEYLTRLASVYVALSNFEQAPVGLIAEDVPEPLPRARPAHGEGPAYFGKVVYVDEPSKYWPRGSECPIHERVHDSHGWYVCLPVATSTHFGALDTERAIRRAFVTMTGKPAVGDLVERVQTLIASERQHHEASSHREQIAVHYRDALTALVQACDPDPLHEGMGLMHVTKDAVTAATTALAAPPEWDGKLRS